MIVGDRTEGKEEEMLGESESVEKVDPSRSC